MTALGDSNFLDDLEGLGEDSDEDEFQEVKQPPRGGDDEMAVDGAVGVKPEDVGANGEGKRKKEEDDEEDRLLKRVKGDTLAAVATLSRTRRYQEHVARVASFGSSMEGDEEENVAFTSPLEADPQYQLIVASNRLVQDIDDEIQIVHRFVADAYAKKFPELESLVPAHVDYARVVQRIGNEMDLTLVNLSDLLPTAAVMVVSVTASSTSGKPLELAALQECLAGCAEVLTLFEDRNKILSFVERRMGRIAPNVCLLVGSKVASQLMGLAGGLVALSRVPANHIQVMGQEKKALGGSLAAAQGIPHAGVIINSELVLSAPPALRLKALRLVASKVALAARMDAYQQHASGEGGQSLRAECEDKIEKWQEPPKGKEKKALPVPDMEPKKKRGGKRVRKFKERFAMTDMRKEANRRAFGDATAGTEYSDEAMGMDVGMLGATGGRLRLPAAKEQKPAAKKQGGLKAVKGIGGSSGATSGMASSLVFTPTQGLELHNPLAMEERKRKLEEANKSWFDNASGFASARPR